MDNLRDLKELNAGSLINLYDNLKLHQEHQVRDGVGHVGLNETGDSINAVRDEIMQRMGSN